MEQLINASGPGFLFSLKILHIDDSTGQYFPKKHSPQVNPLQVPQNSSIMLLASLCAEGYGGHGKMGFPAQSWSTQGGEHSHSTSQDKSHSIQPWAMASHQQSFGYHKVKPSTLNSLIPSSPYLKY